MITDERKAKMFDNLVGWAYEHDEEFIYCFFNAAGATGEERKKLGYEKENDFPPTEVYAGFEEIGYEEGMSDDEIAEILCSYLSDNYGFCVNHFGYELMGKGFMLTDIDWDTTE